MTQSGKKMYTLQEVVDALAEAGTPFTLATLNRWAKTGKIQAIQPGRRQWFVPRAEFEKILASFNMTNEGNENSEHVD